MTVYSVKDRKLVTPFMTAIHATVTGLATRTENLGCKLYNSFVALCGVSHTEIINYCETVRLNRMSMPKSIGQKIKLKQGDIKTRVSGTLTVIMWKDEL